jgi:phenylpropionate dioxygenase-like ring-hydroxylating dioxygenase large terminal subunit
MTDPNTQQTLARQISVPTFDRRWYAMYPSHWLARRPVRLRLHGHWLAFWRDAAGRAHAMGDRCPHLGASLAGGRVVGDTLECPYHAFRYDGSGTCVEIPRRARKPIPKTLCVPRYEVRELDGWLFLFWAEPGSPAPEIDYFPDMAERGPRSSHWYSEQLWPLHISRVIENMIDVAHLGAVHRGWLSYALEPTLAPTFELDGPRMILRGDRANKTYAAYCHPNLWMQWLGPRFLTEAALVPEDASSTRIYLRSSQGFVTAPVVGELLAGMKHVLDRFALWQDSRVAFSQLPITSEGHRFDSLVEFDVQVGALRKMRKRLATTARAPDADSSSEDDD